MNSALDLCAPLLRRAEMELIGLGWAAADWDFVRARLGVRPVVLKGVWDALVGCTEWGPRCDGLGGLGER